MMMVKNTSKEHLKVIYNLNRLSKDSKKEAFNYKRVYHTRSKTNKVYNISDTGDTVVVIILAIFISLGFNILDAVKITNIIIFFIR